MTGKDLERLLRAKGGEVGVLCAKALARGTEHKVWEGEAKADWITAIYARRERRVHKVGQPSVGFPEAVADLRAYTGDHVLIGYVDDRPCGGFYFQLFLDPQAARIVACLGVRPSSRSDQ
ncbi:hypothetical protein [Streptomyces radiopugnans]|uniref:hypothetical protein n=1 Tax=Streptomyces radiopugnans TaxID=403935 RepID=UPI003F1D9D5E